MSFFPLRGRPERIPHSSPRVRTQGLSPDSPPVATKADVEAHFATHGTGEIVEIKLMNGFGFIEYKDAMDARDVVPGKLPSPRPDTPARDCLTDQTRRATAFRTSRPFPRHQYQSSIPSPPPARVSSFLWLTAAGA